MQENEPDDENLVVKPPDFMNKSQAESKRQPKFEPGGILQDLNEPDGQIALEDVSIYKEAFKDNKPKCIKIGPNY